MVPVECGVIDVGLNEFLIDDEIFEWPGWGDRDGVFLVSKKESIILDSIHWIYYQIVANRTKWTGVGAHLNHYRLLNP